MNKLKKWNNFIFKELGGRTANRVFSFIVETAAILAETMYLSLWVERICASSFAGFFGSFSDHASFDLTTCTLILVLMLIGRAHRDPNLKGYLERKNRVNAVKLFK